MLQSDFTKLFTSTDGPTYPSVDHAMERAQNHVEDLSDEKVMHELKGYGRSYERVMEDARDTLIDCIYWSDDNDQR